MIKAKVDRPPLAEINDLLGTKWVMRIIWELRGDDLTFRALQSACDDLSPTVLNDRLKLLETGLIVEKQIPSGYGLTKIGRDLLSLYEPLNRWAIAWKAERLKSET